MGRRTALSVCRRGLLAVCLGGLVAASAARGSLPAEEEILSRGLEVLATGRPQGELPLQALLVTRGGRASGSSLEVELQVLVPTGSVPPGPTAGTFRLGVVLVQVDEPPEVRVEILEATEIGSAAGQLLRLALEVPEELQDAVVVVDEIRTGLWGAALVEWSEAGLAPSGAPAAGGDRRSGGREAASTTASTAPVRLLPPRRQPVRGRLRLRTLVSDPAVARVDFLLDGRSIGSDTKPPFVLEVDLGPEVVERRVEVEAYDGAGSFLGRHALVFNPRDASFSVRIQSIEGDPADGAVTVHAEVTVPPDRRLERLDFFFGDTLAATRRQAPFTARVPTPSDRPEDFLRVAALLDDGTTSDDAVLLAERGAAERVAVNLVELYVVVTEPDGTPVSDLRREDFSLSMGGDPIRLERFGAAEAVPLVLGLVIDTSESMDPIMLQTRQAGIRFLANVLQAQDRAFIVDFDTRPRLALGATGELGALVRVLGGLRADGATALYDAIIFSLLQFEESPGRRALVVLSDGDDVRSRYGSGRCIEYGRTLGVPVYILGLAGIQDPRRGLRKIDLEGITEGTGGRIFYISDVTELGPAYDRIEAELRSQYVLAFGSDHALSRAELRRLRVRVPGKGRIVRVVAGGRLVE